MVTADPQRAYRRIRPHSTAADAAVCISGDARTEVRRIIAGAGTSTLAVPESPASITGGSPFRGSCPSAQPASQAVTSLLAVDGDPAARQTAECGCRTVASNRVEATAEAARHMSDLRRRAGPVDRPSRSCCEAIRMAASTAARLARLRSRLRREQRRSAGRARDCRLTELATPAEAETNVGGEQYARCGNSVLAIFERHRVLRDAQIAVPDRCRMSPEWDVAKVSERHRYLSLAFIETTSSPEYSPQPLSRCQQPSPLTRSAARRAPEA